MPFSVTGHSSPSSAPPPAEVPPEKSTSARALNAAKQGIFTLVMPSIAGQRLGPLPTQYSPVCLPTMTAIYHHISGQAQPALHGDVDQHIGALATFLPTLGMTPAVATYLPNAISQAATSTMGPKGPAHVATMLTGSAGAILCGEATRTMRPEARQSDIRPTTPGEIAQSTAIQTAAIFPGLALRAKAATAGQNVLKSAAHYFRRSNPGATALACVGAAVGLVPAVIALGVGKGAAYLAVSSNRDQPPGPLAQTKAPGVETL